MGHDFKLIYTGEKMGKLTCPSAGFYIVLNLTYTTIKKTYIKTLKALFFFWILE